MTRINTLNNLQLENMRRTHEYQAVITDLALEGAIPLSAAEALLGYEIPSYLHSPSGKCVERGRCGSSAHKDAPRKGAGKQSEESARGGA